MDPGQPSAISHMFITRAMAVAMKAEATINNVVSYMVYVYGLCPMAMVP